MALLRSLAKLPPDRAMAVLICIRVYATLICIGVYATSFFVPTIYDGRNGLSAFLTGWDSVAIAIGWHSLGRSNADSVAQTQGEWTGAVAWFANPAIWLAIVLLALGKHLYAGFSAAIALSLASYMMLHEHWGLLAPCPGYWCWAGSAALLLLASWITAPRRFGDSIRT